MNPLWDALFAPHVGSDRVFLDLGERQITYGAFLDLAARFAAVFEAQGIVPGDRIVCQADKSPAALAVYAACVQRGIVLLPLNTAYTPEETAYFLTDSGAALYIGPASRPLDMDHLTLEADGTGTLSEACGAPLTEVAPRSEDDLAALLYTSGTTGRSKGAMLSQQNLLSNARTLTDQWGFTGDDVLLHALPIFHTHGLFVATNVILLAGGSLAFLPKFDLDAVLDRLPRSTTMMGVPTFYTRLLGDPRFTREAAGHMRLFISGSAPLLAETHEAFEARTGHRILERYGMTETNMSTSNPLKGERRAGTVGMPLPGVDLRLRDGVIEVKGPNVFRGYWNMPEKTAEEFTEDDYFITGDLGQIDEDGYVEIIGRAKDLIISGGYNVYPKEVEAVLDEVPGVVESAVIGVADADLGEVPLAVLATGGTAVDMAKVEAAAEALARFKRPRQYEVVDALPRNTMGKVQKVALRQRFG